MHESSDHNQLIVDQFTRMAAPFARMPAHSDQTSMQLLMDVAAIGSGDRVLDVCCGPGLVSCAIAPRAGHVTGIDITPAMIDQANRLQKSNRLDNMDWVVGDVTRLPFPANSFSVVLSRYAFHHLLGPATVLREMARVCRPGGRVVLADVFCTSEDQRALYDQIEKLRDPSHVRALLLQELQDLFAGAALTITCTEYYRLGVALGPLLAASCTGPVGADKVRQILVDDIAANRSGFAPHLIDGAVQISFPVVILAGNKM
jgi:ubiquinone/menaquinone biosynthesis C-methylase UbiE